MFSFPVFPSIRHAVDHCAHTHTHTLVFSPLRDASPDSKCLLTASFTSDSLNDFITINDRDGGAPRRVARCSGTAVLPVPLLVRGLMIVLYMPLTSFSSSQRLLPPVVDGLWWLLSQQSSHPGVTARSYRTFSPASQQISHEPIATAEVRGQRKKVSWHWTRLPSELSTANGINSLPQGCARYRAAFISSLT